MNRDSRRRACALDSHAGPAQSEFVGGPGRQIVLVIADGRRLPRDTDPCRLVAKDHVHVSGRAFAREYTNRALIPTRVNAGDLKRLVGAFQEHTLLRINEFGLACAVVKKFGIEELYSLKRRRRLDVGW